MDHPSGHGRERAAKALGIDFDPSQDWEWEIADDVTFGQTLEAYQSDETDDEAKFSLMEILIDKVAEMLNPHLPFPPEWEVVHQHLCQSPELHRGSIVYWSGFRAPHEWHVIGQEMQKLRATLL